ncbi:LamG-like jellyroll fold domain-containing protein [Spirosoma areae]
MKNLPALFIGLMLLGSCGGLLWSCETWELPTKKLQRNCVPPSGTLAAQVQQLKVDFSITGSSGTIDGVLWDFGNGSVTATTGMTVSYTYPTPGTYNAKATLTNTCRQEAILLRTISVSDAMLPTVTLQAITTVSTNSAPTGMSITSTGNAAITRYGICYSDKNMVPEEGKDPKQERTGAVAINSPLPFSLTGLQSNTLYYVRSYAVNLAGPAYSAVQTFRTNQNPVVAVNGTASVGATTASVNFVVSNSGSPAAIEYGIYYSSTTNMPDVNSPAAKVSPAVGVSVVVNLIDLTPNRTYYYRSFARLPSGEIIYGPVMSFTTQADPVAQDLIASVAFTNGSLLDVSGYNNHVKLVGTTFIADRKGNANSAILLNGAGDYFYMPENGTLNPEAMSISLWIKPAVIPANVDGRMQIYNKARFNDGLPQTYSSLIKAENDVGPKLTFMTNIKQGSNCQGGVGWKDLEFTAPVVLANWYHLVFTYSGKTARMYFNNILVFENPNLAASGIDPCPGGELKFGAQYKDLPWYFKGAMDDIRIYKRALTASEVQTLFNQ